VGMRMFIAVAGMVTIMTALLALIDIMFYTNILHFTTWGGALGAMSIPTAFCFLFTGAALVVIGASNTVWRVR